MSRTIRLTTSSTLPDAVVWNPWIEKSLKMAADFGADEYLKMVCVEVGAVATPVFVAKGHTWEAVHTIAVTDSSKL